MTDRQRILDYLTTHGEVTSYDIRVKGLSGNPSQRITELQGEGHDITAERFLRDGRPCTLYTLRPVTQSVRAEGSVERSTPPTRGSRVSGSGGCASPILDAAANSGTGDQDDPTGGDGSPAVAALPTLFEMETTRPRSHYEEEAA